MASQSRHGDSWADRIAGLDELAAQAERGSRAALAGFVFSALFLFGWILLETSPPFDASAEQLVAFFGDPEERRTSLWAGIYVLPFGAVAFIWFMGALRARILRAGGRENTLFSSVQLVSGTLFAAAILLVGGIELAIVRGAEVLPNGTIDVEGTRVLLTLGASASQIMALRMGAVFIAISTSRAARAGLFPRWFALISLILATALLLVATKWHAVVLAIPVWVAATSVVVLSQRHNRPVPVDV